MENLYKQNRLYKTIILFSKIRHISIAEMCKNAEISPGIITDLKMGRKKSVQIETATKIAKALDIPVDLLKSCEYELNDSWDVDTFLKWHDADSDADRLFLLRENGIPNALIDEAGRVIIDEFSQIRKPQTFHPFTKTDAELIELGGFSAISEFYNLPEDAQKKALEDIRGFAEYVIEKYKKLSSDNM